MTHGLYLGFAPSLSKSKKKLNNQASKMPKGVFSWAVVFAKAAMSCGL
jgi:hypothetical protein